MTNKSSFNVAVVGATGAVGEQILSLLAARDFPIASLKLLSSSRSAGKKIKFKETEITVEEATPDSFSGIDIAWFSAGGSISKALVPHAVAAGALCIDNTSAYRMDPDVPLIVPEVNGNLIKEHQGIIANPNCSTTQLVVALKPLLDAYGIERIITSTYQAVSGAGAAAVDELIRQTEEILTHNKTVPDILPVGSLPVKHQIAFNAIPQIDQFADNDYTLEEMKMVNETKKIFADASLQVTATCVRIPVLYGHSESIYVELKRDFEMDDVRHMLAEAEGIVLVDDPEKQQYPLATEAAGKREVYVGRLRRDLDERRALNMWAVSDNLLKGAAWNAVQIAEWYIK